MHLKISSAKWRLFGLGLNELKPDYRYSNILKFKESLAEMQWDKILNEKEAQTAHNTFSNMLTH